MGAATGQDEVDAAIGRHRAVDPIQERADLPRPVPGAALAHHDPHLGIQGGKEQGGALRDTVKDNAIASQYARPGSGTADALRTSA